MLFRQHKTNVYVQYSFSTNERCVYSFAGSDTTAISIRAILYYLMKAPEAMRKLVDEIDEANAAGRLSRPRLKYAEAVKLPYLVAACKEGMRMHPSVGLGLPRHVPEGGKEIAGRFFPGGARVSINACVVHFDEGIFGADAAEFNPDRWFRCDAANMDRHMLQFGGGSRTCIGKNVRIISSPLHDCLDADTGILHTDFSGRDAQAHSGTASLIQSRVIRASQGVEDGQFLVQQTNGYSSVHVSKMTQSTLRCMVLCMDLSLK